MYLFAIFHYIGIWHNVAFTLVQFLFFNFIRLDNILSHVFADPETKKKNWCTKPVCFIFIQKKIPHLFKKLSTSNNSTVWYIYHLLTKKNLNFLWEFEYWIVFSLSVLTILPLIDVKTCPRTFRVFLQGIYKIK